MQAQTTCPTCGAVITYEQLAGIDRMNCPACTELVRLPAAGPPSIPAPPAATQSHFSKAFAIGSGVTCGVVFALVAVAIVLSLFSGVFSELLRSR